MKFKILPLLVLAALPAMAQERWQVGIGFNGWTSTREDYASANTLVNFKKNSRVVPGLQAGYTFKHFTGSDLSATAEYQFNSSAGFSAIGRGTSPGGGSAVVNRNGKMEKSFFAPGIQWNFHPHIDLGLGLQYRFERLHAYDNTGSTSTNNDRPWLNLYWGYTFKTEARVKPFVAFRSSFALSFTSSPGTVGEIFNTDGGEKRLMRSMAGDSEGNFQVGVRF